MRDGVKRLVIWSVVILAMAAGTVAAKLTSSVTKEQEPRPVAAAAGASEVAPEGVSSTAWYCVSAEPAHLVLTNSTRVGVSGTVSRAPGGTPATVYVPPGGQAQVSPLAKEKGPQAATVLLDNGGVAVSQLVASNAGWSVSQCASDTSSSWYFPQGSTVASEGVTLDLYNPAVTPAVVDVDLATPSGEVQPSDYQGVSVPSGGVVSESIDEHATNDPEVATIVHAASGSVVAEELTITHAGGAGLSDQLGAPYPARSWAFPSSQEAPRGSVSFNILNPNASAVTVVLRATYGGRSKVHPVIVSLPGTTTDTVRLSSEPGFEASIPYSVVVTASRGIVVGRVVTGKRRLPEPVTGGSLGVVSGAREWLVPAAPKPYKPWMFAIQTFGTKPVEVRIETALGGPALPDGAEQASISPGSPATLSVKALEGYGGPWIVSADEPIAIEFDGAPGSTPGVVVVPAFVLPGH